MRPSVILVKNTGRPGNEARYLTVKLHMYVTWHAKINLTFTGKQFTHDKIPTTVYPATVIRQEVLYQQSLSVFRASYVECQF